MTKQRKDWNETHCSCVQTVAQFIKKIGKNKKLLISEIYVKLYNLGLLNTFFRYLSLFYLKLF